MEIIWDKRTVSLTRSLLFLYIVYILKVRKKAKIRNRHNQAPHLTKDITWEIDKKYNKTSHTREPRGQPFPSRWPQGYNEPTSKHDKHET